MPRSSETVAALASALAKAQAELINPEKSLTATIRTGRPGDGERSFRYAPLSSGLDIVRKTLGQHEIATLQTTAIDQAAGMVNLTTTLAHASGEWIASDWPVCPIAETANPQRMGAALTYARRYALFTLVGIAGEDDLDAPDLCDGPLSPSAVDGSFKPTDDQLGLPPPRPGNGGDRRGRKGDIPITLDPERSAALREKLLMEVGDIASTDLAAAWAREALAAKNSLTTTDAKLVEDAFERRLSELPSSEAIPSSDDPSVPQIAGPQGIAAAESTDAGQAKGIDKSILTVAAPRRYRNREHLRYVAQQACLVCGRKPSDPHHLGFTQPRALGRKVSDEFAVPLCRGHHRAVHRSHDERAWWRQAGIDPIKIARRLWRDTRGMGQRRSQRAASSHSDVVAPSSDPRPENKDINAAAPPQEETLLPDLPG
jgi:ERF superfamily